MNEPTELRQSDDRRRTSFERYVASLEAADPTLRDRIEAAKRDMFGDDEPPEGAGVPVKPRPQGGAGEASLRGRGANSGE